MLNIAVLGAGHLGKIHLKLLKQIDLFTIVGFYDPDDKAAKKAVEKFGIERFTDIDTLIDMVDVVDIVTPTVAHFDCAKLALAKGKHIFIEKPLTSSLEEAESLVKLVHQSGVKAQVGHVERFNPAFLAIKDKELSPMFIETHRLAQFNPRGTDVSVVLDLMIHDLDIILSIVNSEVKDVQASGVAIVSDTPDIANARIAFENGCVANVTASRMSLKNMRKMRFFQKDAYISVDFLAKKSQIIQLSDQPFEGIPSLPLDTGNVKKRYITFDNPTIENTNAIQMELHFLGESILKNKPVAVSVEDGYKAMKLAYEILAKM